MTYTAKSVLAMMDAAQNAGLKSVALAMANHPGVSAANETADRLWATAAAANKELGNGKSLSFNELHALAKEESFGVSDAEIEGDEDGQNLQALD